MKILLTCLVFMLLVIGLANCVSQNAQGSARQTAPSRVLTEDEQIMEDIKRLLPPVPSSFTRQDSARLMANWKIGIKFYKVNCARCHGIFGTGKDSIPNFSKQQMDDYKAALLAQDKVNHAAMAKMTEEELNDVFLFIIDMKR